MTDAVIKESALQEANQAFTRQVTNQVARITGELNRLEKWLDGDSRELSTMMIEERIQCITRMSNHLALELEVEAKQYAGMDSLQDALRKLESALAKKA